MKSDDDNPPMSRKRSCRAIFFGGFEIGVSGGRLDVAPRGARAELNVDRHAAPRVSIHEIYQPDASVNLL